MPEWEIADSVHANCPTIDIICPVDIQQDYFWNFFYVVQCNRWIAGFVWLVVGSIKLIYIFVHVIDGIQ